LTGLLICHVGGPGTTAQAEPVLKKFLRQMEQAAGFKENEAQGAYYSRFADCKAYAEANKPVMGAFDLATYLRIRKEWKLQAFAHVGSADAKRYHVVVRKDSHKDLASLKGKTLIVSAGQDPRFLSKIIFAGKKLDAAKHFVLQETQRPLRGIRAVARGTADATLIDETAYAHLQELKLPTELASVYSSKALPGLTLAVIGTNSTKSSALIRRMIGALPKLCAGAGESLCRSVQVKSFHKADPKLYRKLQQTY
jgi:hypothetical protein